MSFLNQAVTYGNIVVTENMWAHHANTTGLASRYNTKVFAAVDELPGVLKATGCL